jgi:hypothetical protein
MTLSELPQQPSVHHPSLFDRPVEQCSDWPAHNTPTPTHRHPSHHSLAVQPILSRLRHSYPGV